MEFSRDITASVQNGLITIITSIIAKKFKFMYEFIAQS
jgi:hypothetical protein